LAIDAIKYNIKKLYPKIAPERIRIEILKAMNHKTPSIFFKNLHLTGLLKLTIPSLDRCFDLDGGPHHGETVFEHCMLVGDALCYKRPLLRIAGYLHDVGKYDTACIKNGRLTFLNHEKYLKNIENDLQKLRFSTKEIEHIKSITRVHMRPLTHETTPKAVRKLICFLEKHKVTYKEFMRLRIADKAANLAKRPYTISEICIRLSKIKQELGNDKNSVFNIKDLDISGHDIMKILNINQGTDVGKVIKYLFNKVLDEPYLNSYSQLKKLARNFYHR